MNCTAFIVVPASRTSSLPPCLAPESTREHSLGRYGRNIKHSARRTCEKEALFPPPALIISSTAIPVLVGSVPNSLAHLPITHVQRLHALAGRRDVREKLWKLLAYRIGSLPHIEPINTGTSGLVWISLGQTFAKDRWVNGQRRKLCANDR